ncbi:cache domain-containing sensor histidine kinase [Paenibacillus gansuensis]|uniref:histidine kinase n=1 Tax=Paenibacillus gansuensis TaxID=306542 RepID=A0ABW5PKS2_9BACL
MLFQPVRRRKKFATKIVTALLIGILFSITMSSAMFYSTSSKLVKKNVRTSSLQLVRQAAETLSGIIISGNDASNVLYSDVKLQEAVRTVAPDSLQKKEINDDMNRLVNNFVASNSFVKTLYVLREEGTSWGSGSFKLSKVYGKSIRELPWVQLALQKDGEPVWGALAYDPFSGVGDRNDLVLPVTRVIKDFESLEDIGYLLVNMDGQKVLQRIQQIRLGNTGRFYVVDGEGRVMIDGRTERIGLPLREAPLREWAAASREAEFEFEADGVRYYNIKQPLSNGWSMIGTVPVHEITDELIHLRYYIWSSSLGFAFMAVLFGLLLARQVTKPIKQLTAQMKVAETGDFTARTEVNSQDEIGQMSRQFNKMIRRIDSLIHEVQEVQASKQQAELRAVMHRIHPHFLFNTLSTIKWLVRYNETSRAYEALSALVLLLEANMGKKGNFVTLAEELDIVQKYLTILEIRYDRPFRFHLTVDPALLPMTIPRMLIQPVIENAIFHGIVPTADAGDIWLNASEEADRTVIEISDNGAGISEQRIRQLDDAEDGEGDGPGMTGIGLRHVRESIQLYFPAGSSMRLDRRNGGGTAVILTLLKPDQPETLPA